MEAINRNRNGFLGILYEPQSRRLQVNQCNSMEVNNLLVVLECEKGMDVNSKKNLRARLQRGLGQWHQEGGVTGFKLHPPMVLHYERENETAIFDRIIAQLSGTYGIADVRNMVEKKRKSTLNTIMVGRFEPSARVERLLKAILCYRQAGADLLAETSDGRGKVDAAQPSKFNLLSLARIQAIAQV